MRKHIMTPVMLVLMLAGVSVNAGASDRVVGGDISLVPAYEDAGDDWLDADGKSITDNYTDGMITYLRDVAGWTSMRVRLLVDPTLDDTEEYDEYLGTCQDLDYVKKLGKRIKDAGLDFLLDIFYSDTWTDVSKQWIPNDWSMDKSTDTSTLAAKVKSYTTEVIDDLVAYGAKPDYVQIGNEVSYGMLWDSYTGKNSTSWLFNLSSGYSAQQAKIDRFAALLTAAAEGVRASTASSAKIILHSERTINSTYTKNFYDWVGEAGFEDYDIIGLSYYPAWQGSLSNLTSTLSTLTSAYSDKEIQIVETGYYSSSDAESSLNSTEKSYCTWGYGGTALANYLSDLTTTLKKYSNVTGLYYWQPEECGNGADSSGNNRVKSSWDYRGFWNLSWKSGSHTLISSDALMTLKNFLETDDDDSGIDTDFDSSEYFTNLDFESCSGTTVTGWEVSSAVSTKAAPTSVASDGYMSSLVDGYAVKLWNNASNSVSANTVLLYQTSSTSLPAGTYTVSAVVHADGTDGMALYVTDGTTTKYSYVSDNDWGDAATYSVEITLDDEATLTIGIIATDALGTGTAVNMYCDNFKIVKAAESSAADMKAYYTNLDFEDGDISSKDADTACPGWTLTSVASDGPWPTSVSEDGYMSSLVDGYDVKLWNDTGNGIEANTVFMSQGSSEALPAGDYEVSAVIHADGTNGIALYASDGTQTVTTAVTNSGTNNWGSASVYTVDITLENDAVLTVGIMTTAALGTGTAVNMYCDNFTVTQLTVANGNEGNDGEDSGNGEGTVFEASEYFGNLDFDDSTAENGGTWYDHEYWLFDYETFMYEGNNTLKIDAYDEWMDVSGFSGLILYAWPDGSTASNSDVPFCYQTSFRKLPAGTYTVTADVFAVTSGIALYAVPVYGDGTTGTVCSTDVTASGTSATSVAATSVTVTLSEDAYLEIGLKTTSAMTYSAAKFMADNFTVTQTSATEKDPEDDVDENISKSFTNLDFETMDTTGWTVNTGAISGTGSDDYGVEVTSDMDESQLTSGYCLNVWVKAGTTVSDEKIIYQSASVDPGVYYVTAITHCNMDGFYVYANDVQTACHSSGTFAEAQEVTVGPVTVTEANSTLEIGIKANGVSSTYDLDLYADNFNVTRKQISIVVTSAEYATYYSDYSYEIPDGLSGAIVRSYAAGEDETGTIELSYLYEGGDVVPAKTPIVIKGTAGTYRLYAVDTTEADTESEYLYGSSVATRTNVNDSEDGYYFYKLAQASDGSVGFYYGAKGGAAFDIAAHRAWLAISTSDNVKLTGFLLEGGHDGETTGITAVTPAAGSSDAIYNLQGMRVNDTSKKGLYIIGGKKVIVK